MQLKSKQNQLKIELKKENPRHSSNWNHWCVFNWFFIWGSSIELSKIKDIELKIKRDETGDKKKVKTYDFQNFKIIIYFGIQIDSNN